MLIDEKELKELIRDAMELKITLNDQITKKYIYQDYFMFIPPIGSIVRQGNYPYGEYKVEEIYISSSFEAELYVTRIDEE